MKQMNWFVDYCVLDEQGEILFTGGEFTDAKTSRDAILVVIEKYGHLGAIRINSTEEVEINHGRKKKS